MHIGLQVKYSLFLSDFDKILIFSKRFSKRIQIYNFIQISSLEAELLQTDRHDEANISFVSRTNLVHNFSYHIEDGAFKLFKCTFPGFNL